MYLPGLVVSKPQVSLLDHVLGTVEQCHAELGRYTFAAQEAFTPVQNVAPVIDRKAPDSPLYPMKSGVGKTIIDFYQQWLRDACAPQLDADTYGETVTSDVTALLSIMERVNLGKPVAEAKYLEQPEAFKETQGDRDALLSLLVKKDREAQVLAIAESLAQRYELDSKLTVAVFDFMIRTTIDIEIDYLRMRISAAG